MKPQTVSLPFHRCVIMGLFGSLLFIQGCATTPPRPTHYPLSAKHWNGIDAVEFLQEFKLEDYSRLVVAPFDTSTAVLPPKEENTYQPTVTVLNQTDGIVLTELTQKLKGKLEVAAQKSDASPPEKTLLLRGKVADIHPGSQAARYWVGFGAGSAWVKINGEVVDAKTQAVLFRFEQQRVGAVGMFGGGYIPMLTDCVVAIGRDIGRLVTLFKTP